MTTHVKIESPADNHEPVTLFVVQGRVGADGDFEPYNVQAFVLAPGNSHDTYVYENQRLMIGEGEPETASPKG